MRSSEVRKKYLDFFEKRGHVVITSSSLIPEGDATTLFTGSGMQPLLPYLLGKTHPDGRRLTDSQKSFRAEDIEEVGDNRHTTFFEMLGNWSLGDYFKKEQLGWFFEFLTDEIGLDPKKLYVTVFAGDDTYGIPRDDEAVAIWKELFASKGITAEAVELGTEERGGEVGMQSGRIFYYGAKKNWWSRSGTPEKMPAREPGGPDSEVFYEFENIPHDEKFGKYCHPNCDCGRYMEIGNSVFMEYVKTESGSFEKLAQRNVDFGGGLERITAASINNADVFTIDSLGALAEIVRENAPHIATQSVRIIADHVRAAVFLINDGVTPSNKDRGYLLRRLIRRAVMHGAYLVSPAFLKFNELAEKTIEIYADAYPQLQEHKEHIIATFAKEEQAFSKTYHAGIVEFERISKANTHISGSDAFLLSASYGFPIELTQELAGKKNISVDRDAYEKEVEHHRELSKAGAQKKFGGHGLILDTGELKAANEEELKIVTRLHTTTHLLHQALRRVLGESVHQAGSDITPERTRFDFTFERKLTPEEIAKVETIVNEVVEKDLPVQKVVLPKSEAERTGALFFFKEKYPDPVNVYFVGNTIEDAFSKEFCGGPHVTHTGEIGKIKIIKEEAVAAGVRRLRAVVE